MPGGQYTNLKEQAASMGLAQRWPEIARTYAEVNQLFGDIVKVTPSSKVVGDMAMFLITRGIKPADVLNLEPGSVPFPESVIDMLARRPRPARRRLAQTLQKSSSATANPFTAVPAPASSRSTSRKSRTNSPPNSSATPPTTISTAI